MGSVTSTDTRRISFDNNFALSPAISVQNTIEDDNVNVLQIENLTEVKMSWLEELGAVKTTECKGSLLCGEALFVGGLYPADIFQLNDNDVLLDSDDGSDVLFKESNKSINIQEGDSAPDYWSQRLEALKKEHQLINKIVETEYEKTTETAKKYYDMPNITPEKIQKIKPCYDWRSKIMQCYEDNPHQPLVCSGIVKAFSHCVASCRSAKE